MIYDMHYIIDDIASLGLLMMIGLLTIADIYYILKRCFGWLPHSL